MPFMCIKDYIIFNDILYDEIILKDIMLRLCAFFSAGCFSHLLRGITGFFLYLLTGKLCKCRSPPFINFELKKFEIDRRKERWQNAQKEENIRIILIH